MCKLALDQYQGGSEKMVLVAFVKCDPTTYFEKDRPTKSEENNITYFCQKTRHFGDPLVRPFQVTARMAWLVRGISYGTLPWRKHGLG